jgi:hypothetical protein
MAPRDCQHYASQLFLQALLLLLNSRYYTAAAL